MPPMSEPSSKMAHQDPEWSLQAPTPTNSVPTTNSHIFVDTEGRPLSIYVSKSVPDRENVEEQIKEYGGILVDDESKATIRLGPPGRDTKELMFSSQWVYDCLKDKVRLAHDTFAYRLGTVNRTSRSYYSRDDDKLLEEFIASKRAEGAFLNGNKIYEELAENHKQHPAQSWRNRAIELNLTSKPSLQSPYELSKAKREEARRRQQEKLAADKLKLEVAQQKILGQKWQATHHDKSESEQKPIHSPPKPEQQNQQPPAAASSTTQHIYQTVDSDSDEGVIQESPLRLSHHPPKSQQSQQAILVFSDIESTDEEDRFHKDERNAIANRRNNSSSQMSALKSSTSQPEDKKITPSQPMPDTLSAPIQDAPALVEQDEHATDDSRGPTVASDTQEVAIVESIRDESPTKDVQDISSDREAQDEPAVDDLPVVDDLYNNPMMQEPADGLDQAGSFQASVSDQEISGDLTDEDDIAIEQRILGKKQAHHLSPLVSRERRSSSPIPASSSNTTRKTQEVRDSDDDHQAYELPAKLLSRSPAQHQTQWSQTVWSTGMSFQFKKMVPTVDGSREGSESVAELSAVLRDVSGPVSRDVSILDSDGEDSQEGRAGSAALRSRSREGSENAAYLSAVSRDVSILDSDGEDSQAERAGLATPRSGKVDTSMQIDMTKSRTDVETTDAEESEASLSGDELEYRAVADESEGIMHLEQEKEKEGEDVNGDKVDQLTCDTAHSVPEGAHVSPSATSCVIPEPEVEQDSREVSVVSSVSNFKDALLDYYMGEGDDESLERRHEREQLLLYLRDHYRKEIRTLMLHELVPALRSIDVLDACSGDFAMARALISKGMTEETKTHFWTREDDCKLFSSRDEDVKGLLERHSAVELIRRTRYLTRTREEAKQFEVAPDAMEKSGLLKRARGRLGGRESKRQRFDEDES